MSLNQIKRDLKQLSKEELLDILSDLYRSNKAVKDFLNYHLSNSGNDVLKIYKAQVQKALNPENNQKLKIAKGKKAISEFRKLGSSPQQQAELLFYYIECGIDFSNRNDYVAETLFSSLESVFLTALKLLKSEDLLEYYKNSAETILERFCGINEAWRDIFKTHFAVYYD